MTRDGRREVSSTNAAPISVKGRSTTQVSAIICSQQSRGSGVTVINKVEGMITHTYGCDGDGVESTELACAVYGVLILGIWRISLQNKRLDSSSNTTCLFFFHFATKEEDDLLVQINYYPLISPKTNSEK